MPPRLVTLLLLSASACLLFLVIILISYLIYPQKIEDISSPASDPLFLSRFSWNRLEEIEGTSLSSSPSPSPSPSPSSSASPASSASSSSPPFTTTPIPLSITTFSPMNTSRPVEEVWSECARCPNRTYVDYLCENKFVMVVNFTGLKSSDRSGDTYQINIIKTFKRSLLFIIVMRSGKVTLQSPPSCTRPLITLNRSYLITGRVKGLDIILDSCDLALDWQKMDSAKQDEVGKFFTTSKGKCP
ncbi:uncharacterized protein LOC141858075 [Brevipalpus obovatus]|uniref:uncharacterized protein LOC141858075 n=1 Tax=Brevipalpus obovatus TaxID=246614 RepID=UPI003D9E94CD